MSDSIIHAEAVKAVADLATQKEKAELRSRNLVEFHNLPKDPLGRYLEVRPGSDGNFEFNVETPAPPRRQPHLKTLDAMVSYIADEGDEENGVTFYDLTRVAHLYSQLDAREKAVLDLSLTPPFEYLRNPAPRKHAAFVKLLRVTLNGCFQEDVDLVSLVRKLNFQHIREQMSDVQHKGRGMGLNAQSKVMDENNLPEELTLHVPVWEGSGFKVEVKVYFDIDAEAEAFALLPFPVEMSRAEIEALGHLGASLTGDAMPPAYQGRETRGGRSEDD